MSRIVVTDDQTRDEPAELKEHGEADVETSDLHAGRESQ